MTPSVGPTSTPVIAPVLGAAPWYVYRAQDVIAKYKGVGAAAVFAAGLYELTRPEYQALSESQKVDHLIDKLITAGFKVLPFSPGVQHAAPHLPIREFFRFVLNGPTPQVLLVQPVGPPALN
jgi:hypothetical protein